jgi:ABC-type sugar transport system ATPase subunit
MAPTPLLNIHQVSKQFGQVQALDSVSLRFEKGRIYGLAGENGAGKSTLVKVLCGVHTPDRGRIEWQGQPYAPADPAEAEEAGVSVFHQEIPVCPSLSVAANVFLGRRLPGMFPDWPAMERQCEEWFRQWLGIEIDSRRLLGECAIAERQMALLVRALSRQAQLIILDEPTTALTAPESARFFEVVRRLASQGIAFVYVSHFLHELMELSDGIYVLRDGRLAGSLTRGEFHAETLASLIAGRSLRRDADAPAPGAAAAPRPKLEVRSLGLGGAFHDVSFQARQGEILGITGLQGSGRGGLTRALFGAPPAESGEILIDGKKIRMRAPGDAIAAGIGYVPEDRQEFGLFDDLDVRSNLGILQLGKLSRAGLLSRRRLTGLTLEMQAKLRIRLSAPDAPISSLSGGNQQKVLIGRWLALGPAVLVMNEPTRGVDVGAKEEICRLLRDVARAGCCLMVASSDLDELLRLADRILVMAGGKVTREFSRSQASKAELIQAIGTP